MTRSTLDLTGGLDPAIDEITATPPTSPTSREGVSMWLWDGAGRFAFPRVGIEAVGATWRTSFRSSLCMAMPDGRLLLVAGDEPPHPVTNADGQPRVLGAGPLRFECVEPFARWRLDFDGKVVVTDVVDHLAAGVARVTVADGVDTVSLRLQIDASSVLPPWVQGTHEPEGAFVSGEHRFEQLCDVAGQVEVDGDVTPFRGGALRVHRRGGSRSDYADFHGHVWQSARFPSGRAFGLIHYRPRPDGSVKYREGWVWDGQRLLSARVEGTPWMSRTQPSGEDVGIVLRTPDGDITIQGETFVSSFRPPRLTAAGTTFPLLQSGIARYRWGDEVAYGMIERSARLDAVETSQ